MGNFVWLFALLCFQFSRGEDVLEIDRLDDVTDGKVSLSAKGSSEVIGKNEKKDAEEEWTEEDEKWLEEIQSLLAEDSDEDYDMDYAELGKLLSNIEELMKEHYPEKSNYLWLEDIGKWFTEEDEDDYDDDDQESNKWSDESFYSWLHGKNAKKDERPLKKRFTSV